MSFTLPLLLPTPRTLTLAGEWIALPDSITIASTHTTLEFETNQLHHQFTEAGMSAVFAPAQAQVILALDTSVAHPQGYRLTIARDGQISLVASTPAGAFYAVATLGQLLQVYGRRLPTLTIDDWPDFAARGVLLDVSRDRVPTMETLYALVERLASWKINQLQLYMEHTFAYAAHPDVWAEASPLTGGEIQALNAFCRQRHIELVPNQNSLGHMERWFKHAPYRPLAECPDGYHTSWGEHREPTTLNPLDPRSLDWIAGLYDELLSHFSSSMINVGCDEPWELGTGQSKAAYSERGARVYLEYLLKLHELTRKRGKTMQFWGDIIVQHPELVPELPKDGIALPWGYEARHPFDRECALMADAGVPFYVVPGTSSWNSIAGRTDTALGNIRSAAENGLRYGASGVLTTDWGDNGHWQPLPVSYLGFAYGASTSWCVATNAERDIAHPLDVFAFNDAAGVMGRLAADLANVSAMAGLRHVNGSALFYALQAKPESFARQMTHLQNWERGKVDFSAETLHTIIDYIDGMMSCLDASEMRRADADLIRAEYVQAAALLQHGAYRALALGGEWAKPPALLRAELESLIEQQRVLWLARSRPGGLEDSLRRFEPALTMYTSQS